MTRRPDRRGAGRLLVSIGAAVSLCGWSTAGPSPDAPRASVSGSVRVMTPPPSPPPTLSPYARRRYQPPQHPGVPGGPEDAVVLLEPADGSSAGTPTAPITIAQRDRTIVPHVSVAHVGQTVTFPNQDDVFHNLFSLSPENRFSLGRYAPGTTRTHRFERPGVVRLFCDIHSEMAGVILVVTTAYVGRVGADGVYRIEGVPPGRYRAVAWHPTAGADTTEVTLSETTAARLDFVLPPGR